MEHAEWVAVVKDVGFPIVAYGSLGYAVWRVCKWIGENLVIPARDRGFKTLDRFEVNVDRLSSNLDTQTKLMDSQNRAMMRVELRLDRIDQRLHLPAEERNGDHG